MRLTLVDPAMSIVKQERRVVTQKQKEYRRAYDMTPTQRAKRHEYDRKKRSARTLEQRVKDSVRSKAYYASRSPEQRAAYADQCRERQASPSYRARKLAWERAHKYNITHEAFTLLFAMQGGHCALCPATKVGVDHNHRTGCVRGLLCKKCNSGIGMLGDDLRSVQFAADYLRRTT